MKARGKIKNIKNFRASSHKKAIRKTNTQAINRINKELAEIEDKEIKTPEDSKKSHS